MLTLVSSTIATVVTLLAFIVLTPALAGWVIRLALRGLGCWIRRRTKWRKDLIRARVRAEEDDYRSKATRQAPAPTTVKAEDEEDWEKVEGYTGNNGLSASSSSTGTDEKSDWDGVVGFFHPFWYVYDPALACIVEKPSDFEKAMLEEAVSGFCGQLLKRFKSNGRGLYAQSILATTR